MMSRVRSSLALVLGLSLLSPFSPSQLQGQELDTLKDQILAEIGSPELQKLSQQMVDMLFSYSELGFQEFWTLDYVTGILEREGFSVERGCAGMPTCYVGTWGSGKPVVGFMGDIDALPETSQKPGVPWQEPLIPLGPGHGEGHNSTAAVDVVAAIATKRVMERNGLEGTLKVIPGVAEELVASRNYMVRAGLFEGMDIMLSTHISSSMTTGYGISGSGPRLHHVHLPRQISPFRGVPLVGPKRPRCRRADGHRMELSPGAPPPSTTLPLHHPPRGQSTQCCALGSHGLVLFPGVGLPADQGTPRIGADHGRGRGHDDGNHGGRTAPRSRLAVDHEQASGGGHVRQHSGGGNAGVERG